ncbi:unnamed protein product, partial [Symbiodinium pilosum]
ALPGGDAASQLGAQSQAYPGGFGPGQLRVEAPPSEWSSAAPNFGTGPGSFVPGMQAAQQPPSFMPNGSTGQGGFVNGAAAPMYQQNGQAQAPPWHQQNGAPCGTATAAAPPEVQDRPADLSSQESFQGAFWMYQARNQSALQASIDRLLQESISSDELECIICGKDDFNCLEDFQRCLESFEHFAKLLKLVGYPKDPKAKQVKVMKQEFCGGRLALDHWTHILTEERQDRSPSSRRGFPEVAGAAAPPTMNPEETGVPGLPL